MTIKYADRVQETSVSTGAGDLVLDGAVAGFRSINVAFNNDFDATALDFDYVIKSDVNNTFEIGTGKLTTSTLMERTTVTQNSDEDTSKINFATGGLTITVTPSKDTLQNFEGISLTLSGAVTAATGAFTGALSSGDQTITGKVTITTSANEVAFLITSSATTVNGITVVVDALTSGTGILAITDNATFTATNGLLRAIVGNASASGTALRADNDGTGKTADFISASTTNPAINTTAAAVSTNFQRHTKFGALTIWVSDGTTANGNLSGAEGDWCMNGGSGTGQGAYCTGTTNWTDFDL